MNMPFTIAWNNGDTHEKVFATAEVNMPVMRMVMVFMKFTLIPWKAFGRYCDLGCALIAAFLKSICQYI